jgi:3-oxoacyl-(acyl-carrier-protein) synthase III
MSFNIIGTGSSVPKQVITNDDLSKILDTNDEWISTRVGTKTRHILTVENEPEGLLTLALEAGRKAIENAGLSPSDIDMVICSTVQGEYVTPSMSCLISKKLGINCNHVMDMNMACCGFIFSMDMADSYIMSGKVSRVLIICAEAMSRNVDWNDRSMCVLFGDAAGAAVLEKGDKCIDIKLTSDGQMENLYMPHVVDNCPYSHGEKPLSVLQMNGQEIYKFAVKSICNETMSILERNNIDINDVKYFLLHQANKRIIDSAMSKLGQPPEKYPCNIQNYGNTSSATLPLLLDEINRDGMLTSGDLLLMTVFGAGLTTAACLIKW